MFRRRPAQIAVGPSVRARRVTTRHAVPNAKPAEEATQVQLFDDSHGDHIDATRHTPVPWKPPRVQTTTDTFAPRAFRAQPQDKDSVSLLALFIVLMAVVTAVSLGGGIGVLWHVCERQDEARR